MMSYRNTLLAALMLTLTAPVLAAAPVATVEHFNAATLDIMKNAKALGFDGRVKRFDTAVRETFDLPAMTAFAVGPAWAGFSPGDRSAVIEAFARMTAASYAQNFAGYSGEKFTVAPATVPRGADVVVKSQIIASGKPTEIDYRMRGAGSAWKAIDVYYEGGISQLSIRRSEFAATVASGGAAALARKLGEMAAGMKK